MRLPMTKEYMFWKRVFKKAVNIIEPPTEKKLLSACHEKRIKGSQRPVAHSMADFTTDIAIDCHTIAQGP